MQSHKEWLESRTKSILSKGSLTVQGSKDGEPVPMRITYEVRELTYGPVLNIRIKCDVPYDKDGDDYWDDHPFMWADHVEEGTKIGNIVDDTPAVRALVAELSAAPTKLYTTTDCTHKGRIIRALCLFWS